MPEIADTQYDIRPGEDPYARLEIERTADDEVVRKAYFQQVRRFPPEQAPQEFQQIRRAYEQLRTPARRRMTDLFLLQSLPPRSNRRMPACDLSVSGADLSTLALVLTARPMTQDFRPFEAAS